MKYRISEVFCSIQGEGAFAGQQMLFIRFSGCNLSCQWCDTDHSKFEEYTLSELEEEVQKYPNGIVCLTGGEPLLQVDKELTSMLHSMEYRIHIETNGTISILPGCKIDWITVSPKNEAELNLIYGNELKYIWRGETRTELDSYAQMGLFDLHYLQPCDPWLKIPIIFNKENVEEYQEQTKRLKQLLTIIKEEPKWRLSIQIQKLLGIR